MPKSVVALPEVAGTISVEILRSYTRGFRVPRLAKVTTEVSTFSCASIPPKRLCYGEPDHTSIINLAERFYSLPYL